MTRPSVVLCSMWRNDEHRAIVGRVEHLLAKAEAWPNTRFIWVVGDSTDDTAQVLRKLTAGRTGVTVVVNDTGIEGEDVPTRLRRLSQTANEWWKWVGDAEYVICHESDIVSPPDIVNRLVAHALDGHCPIAGWPTLEIMPGVVYFYDSYCYRKDGQRFTNQPPYHACYRPDELFEVDSFGTVYLFDAHDVPHVRFVDQAVMDLCRQLKARGRTLWVDPMLNVEQPRQLWTHYHA